MGIMEKMKTLAHEFLKIEEECGFEVTQKHILEKILEDAEDAIEFNDDPRRLLEDVGSFLEEHIECESNGLLSHGLQNKKMGCRDYSVLYYSILKRLYEKTGKKDFHFHIVNTRSHMFIRYDDGKTRFNWETTLNCESNDEFYISMECIPEKAIENEVYMKNLTEDEVKSFAYNTCSNAISDSRGIEECIAKAIELNSNNVLAYENRGATRARIEDLEGALIDFNEAIKLDPENASVYSKRGILWFELDDLEKAQEDLDKAIKFYKKQIESYYLHNLPDDMRRRIKRGLSLAYGTYAELKGKKGDFDGAEDDFSKAIRLAPCSASYMDRAHFRLRRGDYKGAEKDFTEAIREKPSIMGSFNKLIEQAKKEGDYKAAIVYYNLSIKSHPNCSSLYKERAKLHWKNWNFLGWFLDKVRATKVAKYDDNRKDTVAIDADEVKRMLDS
jgi:tetratricopeptide (TPR) repeat protein